MSSLCFLLLFALKPKVLRKQSLFFLKIHRKAEKKGFLEARYLAQTTEPPLSAAGLGQSPVAHVESRGRLPAGPTPAACTGRHARFPGVRAGVSGVPAWLRLPL